MKKFVMALLLLPMATLADSDLYMVIDLSGGPSALAYPVSYLADIPDGGWTDDYKTINLVLKRIEPGTCVVSTEKPYYVGVFEVTQKQYELITGERPSHFSGSDMRPVECVSYNMIRGSNKGAQYPNSTDVDDDSFMGKLRSRTGLKFDLPTEVQWEYACRAGTTTTYSYGDSADGDYMWCLSNSDSYTHDVGTRKANPWGLYDMHGNVWEWCLDWFTGKVGSFRVERGGSYDVVAEHCTVTSWSYNYPAFSGGSYYGFRLFCNEEGMKVAIPVSDPASSSFAPVCQTVSLSCATEGSTIYYTIDGSDPSVANGRRYKGPFNIYQTSTVKAIAVKDGWRVSAVATATFTKENELSEALNCLDVLPETQSEDGWVVDRDVSHDGVSSMRSGAIGNGETTWMQLSVKGAGRLSFWWRAKCEEPDEELGGEGYYDYGIFMIGGVEANRLAGNDTGWRQFVTNITVGGKHVLRWEYRKDDATSYPPDCAWVDRVQWLPADGSGHTLTTETPVPYSWLDQYELWQESDFEAAAKSKSGKTDATGRELTIEADYVSGTDPTNMESQLSCAITVSNGFPFVTWSPDLNEGGSKELREYKIWGRESLQETSDWEWPTNVLHRFFKVTVEMQ